MATLQRINQALLIELRTQQETNQMLQAQALQQMIGQKVQQDNLKSLFQLGNGYQQSFNAVTPQQTSAGTQWAFHYCIDEFRDTIAATHVPVFFGNLSEAYSFRVASDFQIRALRELKALQNETVFVLYTRVGGLNTDAGTHPVKALTMHS
jgi:hypothetical protein